MVSLPPGAKKGVAKTATFGKVVVVDVAIAITMAVIAVVMYTLLILISIKVSIMYLTIWSENSESVKVKNLRGIISIVVFRRKIIRLIINLLLLDLLL